MRHLSLFSAIALVASVAAAGSNRQVVEGIAVRVNDRILTVSEVRQRITEMSPEGLASLAPDQLASFLNELGDEMCLLERAAELRIELTSDEVTQAVRQLREENQITDDQEFEAMVRASGMTMERLRQRIRESMLINYVMSREVGNIPITEEELRQRYERDRERFRTPEKVHLYHLIFNLNVDRSDLDTRQAEARRLAVAARAGGDFLALVEEEISRGGSSGGDLGMIAISDLRSEVAEAVSAIQTGEISEPFTSPAGVHLVKVVERVPSSFQSFRDVVETVREQELADRYRGRLEGVVERLKRRYVVEVFPELVL